MLSLTQQHATASSSSLLPLPPLFCALLSLGKEEKLSLCRPASDRTLKLPALAQRQKTLEAGVLKFHGQGSETLHHFSTEGVKTLLKFESQKQ